MNLSVPWRIKITPSVGTQLQNNSVQEKQKLRNTTLSNLCVQQKRNLLNHDDEASASPEHIAMKIRRTRKEAVGGVPLYGTVP